MGVAVARGIRADGKAICRYEYDHWIVGRTLYVKATAIEYERATEESFFLAGRRKIRSILEQLGAPRELAVGGPTVVEWDRSKNWADLLTESVTFRLVAPLPIEVLDAATP